MKKASLIALLLAAPILIRAAGAQESTFDFSGVDLFWKITEVLSRDEEPRPEEWAALFATPGYRELMRRESYFSEDSFKNNFRLVFKPSEAARLEGAMKRGANRRLAHYLAIKERKDNLKLFQKRLESGDIMKTAIGKALAFLPREIMGQEPAPPVSFIFFDPDGRGYVPIIIDLAFAADKETSGGLVEFLAHEIHHYFRNRHRAYDEGNIRRAHAGLINALDQLQIEGIADQIDKHESFYRTENPEDTPYAKQFRKNVMDSPRTLRAVNAAFETMAAAPDRISSLASALRRAIPQSGHPTGYYMARAIIEGGDKESLIDTVGNPFAFVYLYNMAALKAGDRPAFSGAAVEFLRHIELDYSAIPGDTLWRKAMPRDLDFSAVERFWEIADVLAEDKNPAAEDWDLLLGLPGYRELAAHEAGRFARDLLEEKISLAMKPSRAKELDAEPRSFLGSPARHFAEVAKRRGDIDAYLESIGDGGWVGRVLADVTPFLPAEAIKKKAPPLFCPTFFSKDLRYGYAVFVFDPLYGSEKGTTVEYFARLFVLKYFRDAVLVYDPMNVRMKHADTVDILDALELHGFMENILSRNATYDQDPAQKGERETAYRAALETAPQILESLDEALKGVAEASRNDKPGLSFTSLTSVTLQDFPLGALPAADYMAGAIIETLGKERLATTCGNPFLFLRTYNEAAARKSGFYRFSPEAMKGTEILEKEYRKN